MSQFTLRSGGPLDTKYIGPDEYEFRIAIPPDSYGMTGRECPNSDCSPAYFKVKGGTGITETQDVSYCPYCRYQGAPGEFFTAPQKDYAVRLVEDEMINGVNRMIEQALGLGVTRKKKFGGGLLSVEMSFRPAKAIPVMRPVEEELRRDVTCPHCGLEHAVFGLATYCPDCGADIFLVHVEAEFGVVRRMLDVVETRRAELGARVAARDVENALEDVVSIFEAVLKAMTRRHLLSTGISTEDAQGRLEKEIRNRYQSIRSATEIFSAQTGIDLFARIPVTEVEFLQAVFEKRHPISHNLGIVDRKYLKRVQSAEAEGREVRITASEVQQVADMTQSVLRRAYEQVTAIQSTSKI